MKFKNTIRLLCVILVNSSCNAQDTTKAIDPVHTQINNPEYYQQFFNKWVQLEDGVFFTERKGPKESIVNDSKVSILKIEPSKFVFSYLSASREDSISKCVVDWINNKQLNIAFNAGMYDLRNKLSSKGILINDENYSNNPNFYEGYNMAICFNPKKNEIPSFNIIDIKCNDFSSIKKQYKSIAQGMRMLDCDGNKMSWNKNPQSCSQLSLAMGDDNYLYIFFNRSPFTHNEMIDYMYNFDVKLRNAIYMEGGPQTSLIIDNQNYRIEKLGSYVSKTYPKDTNEEFWTLPNIIGIKRK